MPVRHEIWKVGDSPQALAAAKLADEKTLEDMIKKAPAILSPDWMLIGQQERTAFGGYVDLLAIAPDGSLVLIELKRDRTPREIVAQALDYASWVETLEADEIARMYGRFVPGGDLAKAFQIHFGHELDEESLNLSHQIVIVAAELDAATERIIKYLNERDIAVNALFFQVFQYGSEQLLSRVWLLDPSETQPPVVPPKGDKEPWNGEYYVSFGSPENRPWKEAREHGYISAGGGAWYSQTLKLLTPGDRVWVKVPGRGYVGVGIVEEAAQRASEFMLNGRPAIELLCHIPQYTKHVDDPDKEEWFVKVKWLDTAALEAAFTELGLFGNQNTVCRPTDPKWRHTVERLMQRFPGWNNETPR
jgi:hypothetical protein